MSKQVEAFEFQDLGVDHAQYFQGAGVAYTDWDDVFVGVGDTAREAAEDALEGFSTSDAIFGLRTPELDRELAGFDDDVSAHVICDEHADDCESEDQDTYEDCECHDECELNHYVALYVRYADEPATICLCGAPLDDAGRCTVDGCVCASKDDDTIECASHDLGLPCICQPEVIAYG